MCIDKLLHHRKSTFLLFNAFELTFKTHKNMNYTPPDSDKSIALQRKVLMSDLRNQKLERMPGFRFSWYYSGMVVEPVVPYHNFTDTNAFVRNCANKFLMHDAT